MSEIDRILEEEGFRSKPYQDHLGNWTFGHGLTYITELESRVIVTQRYDQLSEIFYRQIMYIDSNPVLCEKMRGSSPKSELYSILSHMAYQLGYQGVMRFKKMWAALNQGDFKTAAAEMRDSKWYTQTPERAERLAKRMEALSAD
jgi:lysozyme